MIIGSVLSSNGNYLNEIIFKESYPVNSSTVRIPNDQISAWYEYPNPESTSGAVYPTVPQLVKVLYDLSVNYFENPKSINLMWPSEAIMTLSGFKSL